MFLLLLYKNQHMTLRLNNCLCALQEHLVMSYCPKMPSMFSLYGQSWRQSQPSLRSMLAAREPAKSSFSALHQQSQSLAVRLLTDIAPHTHHSLSAAINEIGGIGVFLFLFAKVHCAIQ